MKMLCLVLVAFVTLTPIYGITPAMADEGLFAPEQIAVPFDKELALKSLVRISVNIYFVATVFERKEDVETFRKMPRKTFLPQGVVLWYITLSKAELDEFRADEGKRLTPGFFEIVRAFEGVTTFPIQKVIPLEGTATGFFVSKQGHILTNYHIMREEIEAMKRTMGSGEETPTLYTIFETPIVKAGRIVGWQPLKDIKLIRNLSAKDWQAGFDGALLKADVSPQAYLPIAERSPQLGEELWHFGFPMRTRRNPERLKVVGYTDADGSLRVSHGKVTEVQDHNFITDADSFSGNSGSPALTRDGKVLGFLWNTYPNAEVERRATMFQGGSIYVTALPVAKKLQIR